MTLGEGAQALSLWQGHSQLLAMWAQPIPLLASWSQLGASVTPGKAQATFKGFHLIPSSSPRIIILINSKWTELNTSAKFHPSFSNGYRQLTNRQIIKLSLGLSATVMLRNFPQNTSYLSFVKNECWILLTAYFLCLEMINFKNLWIRCLLLNQSCISQVNWTRLWSFLIGLFFT